MLVGCPRYPQLLGEPLGGRSDNCDLQPPKRMAIAARSARTKRRATKRVSATSATNPTQLAILNAGCATAPDSMHRSMIAPNFIRATTRRNIALIGATRRHG